MKTQLSFLFLFFFSLFGGHVSQNTISAQQPLIAVTDQMNVIYMGIDNPITVAVENFPAEHVMVTSDDVKVIPVEKGKYNLQPRFPGKVKIKVQPRGKAIQEIEYRVKRIPDPIARLGFQSGGNILASEFIYYTEINAYLQCFDLGKCEITNQEMTIQYTDGKTDPVSIVNRSNKFSEETIALIKTVKAGDTVYFDQIRCKCPGDNASRKINSMVFKIK